MRFSALSQLVSKLRPASRAQSRTPLRSQRQTRRNASTIEALESRLALAVLYVDADAVGANTGTNWTAAYTDLQSALGEASSGDEIWIAPGLYKPTQGADRSASFVIPDGVALYGGFAGGETTRTARNPSANYAILSGDIATSNGRDNSYHVVTVPASATALLDGVHIVRGLADGPAASDQRGGAIVNFGELTLNNAFVASNRAVGYGAGVYNAGTLTVFGGSIMSNAAEGIDDEVLPGYGGGIASAAGSFTDVRNVSIDGNAERGGGIYIQSTIANPATATITNSIIDSQAFEAGGSLAAEIGAQITISNSTLVGWAPGALQLAVESPITLHNSIIGAADTPFGQSIIDIQGPVDAASSYNLIHAASDTLLGLNGVNGNQIGSSHAPIGTGVVIDRIATGPWMSNYVPNVFISRLDSQSPAIDGGDPTFDPATFGPPLTTDFGSQPRVGDGDGDGSAQIDIGAIESGVLHLVVSTTVDENDGDHSAGDLSLREAILLSNLHIGDDVIELPAGQYNFTIPRESTSYEEGFDASTGDLVIRDPLGTVQIIGAGAASTDIDAHGLDRVFYITQNSGARFSGITIRGGDATRTYENNGSTIVDGHGGGIFVDGDLVLEDSIVENNHAPQTGGGLFVAEDAALTMYRSIIRGNSANWAGGLWGDETDGLVIRDSEFIANAATVQGGALLVKDTFLDLSGSTIRDNTAGERGGGIMLWGAAASITTTTVTQNSAPRGGGIFFNHSDNVEVRDSTITQNAATGDGGGIYIYGSQVDILESEISENHAGQSGSGGGIAVAAIPAPFRASTVLVHDATIASNTAGAKGGGISIGDHVNVTLREISVAGNEAIYAGGIYSTAELLNLQTVRVEDNLATAGQGGGLVIDDGGVLIDESSFQRNTAQFGAAAVFSGAYATISDSFFEYNTAETDGGAIYAEQSSVSILSTRLAHNEAGDSGGAVFSNETNLDIIASTIAENVAITSGGGLHVFDEEEFTLLNSRVFANSVAPHGHGGGIYLDRTIARIETSLISNNSAGTDYGSGEFGQGGGIYATGASDTAPELLLTIIETSMALNTASLNGGGIALERNVRATIDGLHLFRNVTGTRGGGLYSDAASLDIANSTFVENESRSAGGGLYVDIAANLTMTNTDFTGNEAGGRGGGAYLNEDLVTHVTGGTYEANIASQGGGMFLRDNVALTLDTATFRANTAEEGGGVFQAEDGELVVQNGRFESNIASENGGAISSTERAQLTVETAQFVGNQAGFYGGAVYVDSEASATIVASVFRDNAAAHGGGMAVAYRATAVVTESSVVNNSATQQGGGVFNDSSTLRLDHTKVRGNRVFGAGGEDAPLYGGGIFNRATSANATLELNNVDITENALDSRVPALGDDDYLLLGAGIANLTGSSQFAAIVRVNSSNISRNTISFAAQGELDSGDIAGKGAGIYSNATTTAPARVFVERSTIDGNRINLNYVPEVDNLFASGGGIHVEGNSSLTVTYSTISNNVAAASSLNPEDDTIATGGGITFASRSATARMVINHATISGNSVSAINQADGEGFTSAIGGGISMFNITVGPASSPAEVAFSTIAFNRAYAEIDANLPDDDDDPTPQPQSPLTAGIYGRGSALSIYQSLGGSNESTVVERAAGSTRTNYSPAVSYTDLGYNLLVGQESNAWLDKLAYNGGTTQTHALLPGSPAIDAGNPAFNPGTYDPPLSMDQRGQPRVLDGGGDGTARIDIGSYELSRTFLFGDLNGDGQVGVLDLIVVQQQLGHNDPTYVQGDLNADGLVDAADVGIIASHLGNRLPTAASASAGAVVARAVTRSTANALPAAVASAAERPAAREARRRTPPASSVDHIFATTASDSAESMDAGKLRVRCR